MNALVTCPGCGFRGRLIGTPVGLRSIVCPTCQTVAPIEQLREESEPVADDALPICVDGPPGAAPPRPAAPPEPPPYTGDYMKDEAARFAQYVGTRLGELHKRRLELTEAENRFETMTMERKQELHRARGAVIAEGQRLEERDAALQAKEAEIAAREAELAAREAEIAAREARVARSESRAADTDRRTAELRAAIDQLDARRAAVAEEREKINRRAEEMDRAELAVHRRSAELDEMDERLRLEQEEFEREREREYAARQAAQDTVEMHRSHETPAPVGDEPVPRRAATPPPLPPLPPPHP